MRRLLLVPLIGGEFLPHLDEGALWVRATMPYTIGFDESAKFAPQVRNVLVKYPQVTVVGSELGRPDDGTDPTGFFNCEFYVGLKPYDDKTWKTGTIHTKEELSRDVEKQLASYPGVIFNFTQPAEDAVDEALTGLKIRAGRQSLSAAISTCSRKRPSKFATCSIKTPGFTELTVVRELGQPSLIVDIDRPKIARYGINVADAEMVVQTAVGGQAATQVIQGEKLSTSSSAWSRNIARARSKSAICLSHAERPADPALRTRHHQGSIAAPPSSIAKTIHVTSAFSFRSQAATSKAS